MSGKRYKEKNKKWGIYVKPAIMLMAIAMLVFVSAKVIVNENEKNRTDVIAFDDLQESIEAALGDMNITETEATQVKVLDFSEASVSLPDFECLRCFENVETIIIEDSIIYSFKGIDSFKNLTGIKVENSKIDDISNLRDLNVTHLSIVRCGISGTIDLGEMPKLLELKLSDNYIESIRGKFPVLTLLNAENNELKTIDSVDIAQSTEELNLAGNPIDKIDGLERFDNINKLKIYNSNIDDYSVLKGMDSLNALYIDKEDMNDDLEYLYDNFRNGDNARKKEYLERYYQIEE